MSPIPWFKVDDNFAFHPKAVAAGNPALGLWVRAGSWCSSQLTDGFIPDHMLPSLGTKQQAKRLVDMRLWDRAEGGYRFHEWVERQPSKGDVEAERAAARERMREFRAKKKGVKKDPSPQVSASGSEDVRPNNSRTSGEVRDLFGNPDPSQSQSQSQSQSLPDQPKREGDKRPRRATALPADFEPNDTNRRVAAEHQIDLDHVLPQFMDHHRAKGSTFKDWHAALNTWIRREKPATETPKRLRPMRPEDVVPAPSGMTPEQFDRWEYEQRRKRGAV